MNKQLQHRLRQAGFAVLAIAALAVIDGGQMNKARAGIRVHARLQRPKVVVHYNHGQQQARAHRPFNFRVTARDRMVARQLARETGYRRSVFLDLRARGMTWKQIGRRLNISHRIVRRAVFAVDHPRRDRGPRFCSVRWR